MAVQRFEKRNYEAIEFSPDGWGDPIEGPDGERTYESTSETASVTVKFASDRGDQSHSPCKVGSKVTVHTNGTVSIKQIT